MKARNLQIIEKKGKPEWAVIPYDEYVRLHELDMMGQDIEAFQKALSDHKEELIPEKIVDRLMEGENPIRVWRDYRDMSLSSLAKEVEISQAYLSQIELGARQPSTNVLKKIAEALNLTVDDLL